MRALHYASMRDTLRDWQIFRIILSMIVFTAFLIHTIESRNVRFCVRLKIKDKKQRALYRSYLKISTNLQSHKFSD